MLSDIKGNMEQFRRHIQQWAQGLHGLKSLTEGSQVSIRANFQEYMMHGMHNNLITDIKQVGQRIIEFGWKREEPILQYHQDEYRGQNSIGREIGPQVDRHNHQSQYHDDENRSFGERDPSYDRHQHVRHKATPTTHSTIETTSSTAEISWLETLLYLWKEI